MGEYNEATNHPNFYERLAPGYRFVRISNAILEQIGDSTPDGGKTKFAAWPGKQKGHYFRLETSKAPRNEWSQKSTVYCLKHFTDDLADSRPIIQYTVATSGKGISAIGVFDAENKPIHTESDERKDAVRQLFTILHDITPHDSDRLLDEIFATRYETLIGSYILSDLALEGTEEEISALETWQATEDHTERIETIMDLVLEESQRYDSPAKQEAIKEAVLNSRTKTNKNKYEPVDLGAAAERVAKEIGKKWKYTVSPEQ